MDQTEASAYLAHVSVPQQPCLIKRTLALGNGGAAPGPKWFKEYQCQQRAFRSAQRRHCS
jgi:hypothetical protein